ncbi:hypothetical protein DY000_02043855 [Brassica cretica]|uniref:Uncharacterized protein n=1 Tax=Brassica cretica TaxID=69181 RepID=A0ABQ7BCA8_BRACR|nr:hypothetical protein DY000_02043855 [Brassica cretica]
MGLDDVIGEARLLWNIAEEASPGLSRSHTDLRIYKIGPKRNGGDRRLESPPATQALPPQLHPDLSSDEPLNSIPSRVPVTTSARSNDQPQLVRERQPRRSRPNKPNLIASSQLAIPKQPARVRSRFILVVWFLQSAKQR